MVLLAAVADRVGLVLASTSGGVASNLWTLAGTLAGAGIAWVAATSARKASAKQYRESATAERIQLLNERFATAAGLLAHPGPASRLAGVHAMAGLADDWVERRQTCIDVLCAYLRLPYSTEPPETAPNGERLAWQADREVRHTVMRVIRDHLKGKKIGESAPWAGRDFDFSRCSAGSSRSTPAGGGRSTSTCRSAWSRWSGAPRCCAWPSEGCEMGLSPQGVSVRRRSRRERTSRECTCENHCRRAAFVHVRRFLQLGMRGSAPERTLDRMPLQG